MSREMWDREYSAEDYVYGREPNDFLEEYYSHIPMGKVLLLADGEGRNAVFLASKGYEVTAVDISSVGLEKARRLADENGVTIQTVCADLEAYDPGEAVWDGVVSIYCHLAPNIRQKVYKRVETSLRKTGVFLLEGYTPEQLKYKTGGPPVAEMMLTEEILKDELPGLKFNHLEKLEREVHEGFKHHGLASVIQAIGILD